MERFIICHLKTKEIIKTCIFYTKIFQLTNLKKCGFLTYFNPTLSGNLSVLEFQVVCQAPPFKTNGTI